MQPTAIWIIYTLMFGYPVPTLGEHEFTSEADLRDPHALVQRSKSSTLFSWCALGGWWKVREIKRISRF